MKKVAPAAILLAPGLDPARGLLLNIHQCSALMFFKIIKYSSDGINVLKIQSQNEGTA